MQLCVCVCVCIYMCVCVCVCVWGGLYLRIIVYWRTSDVKYMCMKIHTQRDKFEVVTRMYVTLYGAEFATEWPRKNFFYLFFFHIFMCLFVVVILTKGQNIIIAFRRK